MAPDDRITLQKQIERHLQDQPRLASDLAPILDRMAFIGRRLAREVGRAAFLGRLGLAGGENVSGEAQKKLDVVANDVLVEAFSGTGLIAMILSEELEDPLVPEGGGKSSYILATDPIDGSSNTDINGSLGTIFGIYRRRDAEGQGNKSIPLPQGSDIVAAGYVLYGPSTLLVYTAGKGVYGFTLDMETGEYLLTHDRIRCPASGKYYSSNLGSLRGWHPNLQRYIDYMTENDPETRRPYSLRYIGALVADLHRCLIEGGIYFYPADAKYAEGKLRLLYECSPLAFVVEQAGGRAGTGKKRILDVETRAAHQRSPLVIGSTEGVALYESFLKDGKPL